MICDQVSLPVKQSSFSEGNENLHTLLEERKKIIFS